MLKRTLIVTLLIISVVLSIFTGSNSFAYSEVNIRTTIINVAIVGMNEPATWNSGGNATWLVFKYLTNFLPLNVSILNRSDLENPSLFNHNVDVLVMTDVRDINTSRLNAVRNWVSEGGRLICVGLTAKRSEDGSIVNYHRLGDVLGLSLTTNSSSSWSTNTPCTEFVLQRTNWFLFNKALVDNYPYGYTFCPPFQTNDIKNYTANVTATTGISLMSLCDWNWTTYVAGGSTIFGLIKNTYGLGESFFFPVAYEDFSSWQEIDRVNYMKSTGNYIAFELYYSMLLDFYNACNLPTLAIAPNGKQAITAFEVDFEGDTGKTQAQYYGVPSENASAYCDTAYSYAKIWQQYVFSKPQLSWLVGKYEFNCLLGIFDNGSGGLNANTSSLINLLKLYGEVGCHSYNHSAPPFNTAGGLYWNLTKWEITSSYNIWDKLSAVGLVNRTAFWWTPSISMPNKLSDIIPFIADGRMSIASYSDIRDSYKYFPMYFVDKSFAYNKNTSFPFFTIPQAPAAGCTFGAELGNLQNSKFGVSPVLPYVWNDAQMATVKNGTVLNFLMTLKSFLDNGTFELMPEYELANWLSKRNSVIFSDLDISEDRTSFTLQSPQIQGLTVNFPLTQKSISGIHIDGEPIKIVTSSSNSLVLPDLSSGSHYIEVYFVSTPSSPILTSRTADRAPTTQSLTNSTLVHTPPSQSSPIPSLPSTSTTMTSSPSSTNNSPYPPPEITPWILALGGLIAAGIILSVIIPFWFKRKKTHYRV